MVEPIYKYQFRLILIGDISVGKSCLLKYFVQGEFDEDCKATIGVDFSARLIDVKNDVRVKLQVWDTTGLEKFRSITSSYYKDSVGVMVVFDVTNRTSFENIETWLREAKKHIVHQQAVYIIVGNKSDCEQDRKVYSREAFRFANAHGLKYFETSAKTGNNVEVCFSTCAQDIYKLLEEGTLKIEEGWHGIKPGFSRKMERRRGKDCCK